MTGDSRTIAASAMVRSKVDLTMRRPPVNCGCSTCSSGRPVTGRMRQTRAGHLDQRGRDQQVGTGRLQLPGQPAQLLGAEVGAGQDGDGVGVGEPDRLLDGAEAADDGDAALHQGGALAGQRQARGDDLEAVEPLVAEPAEHLQDRHLVADHDDAVQELALGAAPVQPAGAARSARRPSATVTSGRLMST